LVQLSGDVNVPLGGRIAYVAKLAQWAMEHQTIRDCKGHLHVLARYGWRDPVELLDYLPCLRVGQEIQVLIPVAEWLQILKVADTDAGINASDEERKQLAKRGIAAWLEQKGVPAGKVHSPTVAAMLDRVGNIPDTMRQAEHLSPEEKDFLHGALDRPPRDVAAEAVEQTITVFRVRRAMGQERSHFSRAGRSIIEVFEESFHAISREREIGSEDKSFLDPKSLRKLVIEKITTFDGNWDSQIGNRPARQVLADQVRDLPEPVLQILASAVCSRYRSQTVGHRWFAAMMKESGAPPPTTAS
jgi:hypothetical protein